LIRERTGASLESIKQFCRQQLAAHHVPVQFHVVAELPRTAATGKFTGPPPFNLILCFTSG
jgi:acyl-coenzyme A synthetase/AMP-(fatty) acid ligase